MRFRNPARRRKCFPICNLGEGNYLLLIIQSTIYPKYKKVFEWDTMLSGTWARDVRDTFLKVTYVLQPVCPPSSLFWSSHLLSSTKQLIARQTRPCCSHGNKQTNCDCRQFLPDVENCILFRKCPMTTCG